MPMMRPKYFVTLFLGILILALNYSETSIAQSQSPQASRAKINDLGKARNLIRQGELDQAALTLRRMRSSPDLDQSTLETIDKTLRYEIPLLKAQSYFAQGQAEKSRQVLLTAIQHTGKFPDLQRELLSVLEDLSWVLESQNSQNEGGGPKAIGAELRRLLESYKRIHGQYPIHREQLAKSLRSKPHLLFVYQLTDYQSNGHGYVLTLRNRLKPEDLLTLRNTGLLE